MEASIAIGVGSLSSIPGHDGLVPVARSGDQLSESIAGSRYVKDLMGNRGSTPQ